MLNSKSLDKHPYIPGLDGIRAIAFLLVYAGHTGLGNLIPGGLGVTIFFFLSGYLITDLLLAQLTVEPTLRVLLEEQLAANYVQESLLHAIASGTKATVEDTRRLIATAHRKKTALADEALGKSRRSA